MKTLWKTVLSLSVIAAASAVFAADTPAAAPADAKKQEAPKAVFLYENIVKILEYTLVPFKKESIVTETIIRRSISREPLPVCHLIFSRKYRPSNLAQPEAEPRKEYIDIVFIPKNSGFKIQNALMLDKESIVPEPFTKLFFGKYGLKWRSLETDYKMYTLYLGEDDNNYYFGHANLSVLDWFNRTFHLKGGFDRMTTLAEALEVNDLDHFTSRYAIQELAKEGDAALPYLEKAIQNMVDFEHAPLEPFLCLKQIPTKKAYALMDEYATTKNNLILRALFQSFADFEYIRPEYLQIYRRMVHTRMAPVIAWRAAQALHIENDILPMFGEYYEKPFSMEDYSMGVRYPAEAAKKEVFKYQTAKKHIQNYLIRNGDLPYTLKVYNLSEKSADREARIADMDAERIAKDSDFLINAPDKDLSFLMAAELVIFDINEKGVNPGYLQRVRDAGIAIMKRLPEDMVRRELDKLMKNLPDGKELNLIAAASRELKKSN